MHEQMLLHCLALGKVQYFLESGVWWRAKWTVVPLSYELALHCMCRQRCGATTSQHY